MYRRYIQFQKFAYNFKDAEKKWRQTGTANDQSPKQKFYSLAQFPYPSGSIHLGHARVYFISDSIARYQRMRGKNVLHPIGFDSFGLPAENAAIQRNIPPQIWTQNNIKQMKEQLLQLGISFDWDRQLSTHKKEYYQWTQKLFLILQKRGLAYKKQAEVNWDPVDQTVLANQQVDINGISWRSGAKIQKKLLNQWFFRITDYAQRLVQGLDDLPWPSKVKQMQKGWIGLRKGFEVQFQVKQMRGSDKRNIKVFIDDIDQLVNCKFITVPVESDEPEIVGKCIHPITKAEILIIAFKELNYQNVDAFAGIPNIDPKKKQLADKFNIDQTDHPTKVQLSGLKYHPKTTMLLRDWLVSRQRFWGAPIPIIQCSKCGIVPSPLPVVLPVNSIVNPLLSDKFRNCNCPRCGGLAKRQSDTLDTFVDSSWYYLRYLDHKNSQQMFSRQKINWMRVNVYVGGIQHAIMHLLYSRFVYKVLYDQGMVTDQEPFEKLIDQGLVKGKTYKLISNGKYIPLQECSEYKKQELIQTFQKMSKSKFNGVSPISLVEKYGSDALRLALFSFPYDKDIQFTETEVKHKLDFMNRVYQLSERLATYSPSLTKSEVQILKKVNSLLQDIQLSMQKYTLHVYLARVMELFNVLKQSMDKQIITPVDCYQVFRVLVLTLSPISPHFSRQLSARHQQIVKNYREWPREIVVSKDSSVEVLVSVDGKFIKKINVDVGVLEDEKALLGVLKSDNKISQRLGQNIKEVFTKQLANSYVVNILCK